MFAYIWPIALAVLSNIVYQICTKSVPKDMDPLASLTVTYLVSAAACGILYFVLNRGQERNLLKEYSRLNWAPFVLIGLEVGFIYAYKAGWQVSTAAVVQSSVLAAALLFVGFALYHEALTWQKLVGVAVCLAGITIINYG